MLEPGWPELDDQIVHAQAALNPDGDVVLGKLWCAISGGHHRPIDRYGNGGRSSHRSRKSLGDLARGLQHNRSVVDWDWDCDGLGLTTSKEAGPRREIRFGSSGQKVLLTRRYQIPSLDRSRYWV